MPSIRQNAIKAIIWTLLGYGGGQVLRFGANVLLTRLLIPEMFGLMSLVNTFIMGLNLFSDVGIAPSIIRSLRGEEAKFLNTAWTIQVLRGFLLWIVCLIITMPIANFYGEPQLSWILPIVGLVTIFQGFNSTVMVLLNRKLTLGKLTIYDLIVQIISLILTIYLAKKYQSIWALIIGNLVSSLLGMIKSHILIPEQKNKFAWDQDAVKEIFSFGKWIFLSTAMMFLASQSDRLMLGKLFPLEILGVYTIAFTFADLPRQISQNISAQVIFPLISSHASIPRHELRAKILSKRWSMLLSLNLMVTILVCFGDLIVLSLYDQRYSQAAWMLPILCFGIWPLILYISIDKSLYAIGKPMYSTVGTFFKFIYMIIFIPLSFQIMGIFGVIIVIAFNDVPSYVVINYGLWKEGLSGFTQDIKATLFLLGLIAITLTIRLLLGGGHPFSTILPI